MLYALHDFQRSILAPWNFFAEASHELLTNPFNPFSQLPTSRRLAANAVLDMPAEYYLETIRRVFQEFLLPKGRLFVRDQLVRPQAIRGTALLTIEGELDDISGNGQTRAAHALCTGIPDQRREHFTAPGAGHYGIFSGRCWRELICPRVRSFIRGHA
jgi:poly(3-hydroxybutyrate) depolymerase